MKRTKPVKVLAILCAAMMLLFAASCDKLKQLYNGIKDEIDDLANQIQEEDGSDAGKRGTYDFVSHDIDGNEVKLADFASAKVIMLNYWEPWCPPCIRELPELEKLYEAYKDKGLVIVGVFESTDMDADARRLISQNGLTYPIVRYEDALKNYSASAVPTTLFVDASGNLLAKEVVGANDYDGWKALVDSLLG
ncbi:MAG: TlpA family protein disulfide reductase [Clostridia bacterium]|nr:TlpA family protein disulfide reductase [Clostridia bacterium]